MLRRGTMGTMAALALLVALPAPGSAAAFEPVASFGSDGAGAGRLSAPGGIAVAPSGDFYIADTGNDRVDVFSSGGEFRFAFGRGVRPGGGDVCDAAAGCQQGEGGAAAGALKSPEGIAVSKAGDVYVAEEGNNRVSVFSAQGDFLFAFGYRVDPLTKANFCTTENGCQAGSNLRIPEDPEVFSQEGPEGALAAPTGVAIDVSGRVYVAEAGNDRVSAFGPLGEFLYTFGREVEGVMAFANICSVKCEHGGWGFAGAGGFEKPAGIALLPGNLIAVTDPVFHRLDTFTRDGNFVRAIGRKVGVEGQDLCTGASPETECQVASNEGAGSLGYPAGIAASPTGAITVGDAALERVSQFGADGAFVRAFGAGVANGANAFQVCTALTGCMAGLQSTVAGATPFPFGVAEACGGSIFVSESTSGLSRVERFGEPGSPAVCPPPSKPAPPPSVVRGRLEPSNVFQLGRLQRDLKHGTATLFVSIPVSGRLELGGRGIRRTGSSLASDGTAALTVRLVGKARRGLLANGHRKVTALITFTPGGGTARTESRRLTMVKKQAKPKHRTHRRG
jgi:hypothetical protein